MEDLKDYPRLIPTKFDEEAYELIKLHCPFCGAEAKDGCRHRLLVLGNTYFEALSPEFIAFTRRLFGFKDDEELTLGTLIPIRLWGTVKQNEDMAPPPTRSIGCFQTATPWRSSGSGAGRGTKPGPPPLFRTAVSRNFGKHSDETPSHGQKKRVRLHTPDSLFLRLTEIPFTPPGRRGR